MAFVLIALATSALIHWEDPLHPAGMPGLYVTYIVGTVVLSVLILVSLGTFFKDDG